MLPPLVPVPPGVRPALEGVPTVVPGKVPENGALERELAALGERLQAAQDRLWAAKQAALLVVLQGRDASGKDGTIRKVFGCFSPLGLLATPFGVPTATELRHDFLWRVHAAAPALGTVGVFNRSHYEDVLAVRVHQLAPEARWRARYAHIAAFERLLVDEGTRVLKLFLHVSREEQGKRLQERASDPAKAWKVSPGDLEDRARWDDFTAAYEEAIERCNADWAPWYLVPADDKKVRNVLVADLLVRVLEGMRREGAA